MNATTMILGITTTIRQQDGQVLMKSSSKMDHRDTYRFDGELYTISGQYSERGPVLRPWRSIMAKIEL